MLMSPLSGMVWSNVTGSPSNRIYTSTWLIQNEFESEDLISQMQDEIHWRIFLSKTEWNCLKNSPPEDGVELFRDVVLLVTDDLTAVFDDNVGISFSVGIGWMKVIGLSKAKKRKLVTYAMKRVAAGSHFPSQTLCRCAAMVRHTVCCLSNRTQKYFVEEGRKKRISCPFTSF